MKKILRITEQDLHKIIREAVEQILNDVEEPSEWEDVIGKDEIEFQDNYDYSDPNDEYLWYEEPLWLDSDYVQ